MGKKYLIWLLLGLLCLNGCQNKTPEPPDIPPLPAKTYCQENFAPVIDLEDNYWPPLNTMVNFKTDNPAIKDVMQELNPIVTKGHRLYDAYHYYRDENEELVHNIALINDHAEKGVSLTIDSDMRSFLEKCLTLCRLTKGYFNPFLGNVIDLYAGKFSPFPLENEDPAAEELKEALKSVVSVEELAAKVLFKGNQLTLLKENDKAIKLNVSAAAKGQVANDLAARLKDYPGEYLIDLGSSNIVTNSKKGAIVGIRSPYNKVASIYSILLKDDLALSSSGDDNNYYLLKENPDIIRSHILNPYTGYSENYYRTVSVLSDDSMIADVLTTALFNVGDFKEALAIMDAVKKEFGVKVEAAFLKEVDKEGQKCDLYLTAGFKAHLLETYLTDAILNVKVID